MEVGLHELFVEIHFVKIPVRAKDNVHVIQASDLRSIGEGDERHGNESKNIRRLSPYQRSLQTETLHSCVCGNDARAFMDRRGPGRGGKSNVSDHQRTFIQNSHDTQGSSSKRR